jgi:hypothetical protein
VGKLPFLGRRLPELPSNLSQGPLTGALRLFRRTRNDEAKEQIHEDYGEGRSRKNSCDQTRGWFRAFADHSLLALRISRHAVKSLAGGADGVD